MKEKVDLRGAHLGDESKESDAACHAFQQIYEYGQESHAIIQEIGLISQELNNAKNEQKLQMYGIHIQSCMDVDAVAWCLPIEHA